MDRIPTTHTGSLPRPADLDAMLVEESAGRSVPGIDERAHAAVLEVVRLQEEAGVDLLNDGEQGKTGYATYVKQRLSGFDGEADAYSPRRPELEEHPDYAARWNQFRTNTALRAPACTSDIRVRDHEAVKRDIATLKEAAAAANVAEDRLFMSAASPGVIAHFFPDQHYGSRDAYLAAIADAMREEYRAIADAGILLQLDCPDLAMSRGNRFADLTLEQFRREVRRNVEALNHALDGIPADRLRMHLCWGNYEGPHTHDVELRDILDLVLEARPAGISLEASNPRHGHEWKVFEAVVLPAGRYLLPGVVDTTTNFVEHPDLIAQRLLNYASVVGRERVVAGTDCGFGTFAGMGSVVPTVVWAKLRSQAEGARRASRELWGAPATIR
ncbi:MAG: cobalamin-independent methionine synthase II family protein [Candidatus Dormibacteraceae bacterium]